jgi:multiple sugar transport system substrate-binding protein
MTRIRPRLLAAGLLLTTLTACSAGPGATPPDPSVGPLTFVSGQQSQNGQLLQDLLTTAGGTGNPVALQITNDTDVQTAQKVLVDAAAGHRPDAVRVTNATYGLLVDAGVAQPVDSCYAAHPELTAQLDQGLIGATAIDGVRYQIPWYVTPNALLYNGDLFRRAGLDPDRPPRTLGEVHTAARAIAALGDGIGGAVAYFGNDYNFQGYLASGGGSFLAPDATRTALDSPAGAAAFDTFTSMAADGSAPVYDNVFAQANDAFATGRLGMFVSSASAYPSLAAKGGFDLRIAPAPHPDGGTPLAVSSTNGFVITTTDPARQRAACDALVTLLSPEAVTKTVAATVTVPINTVAVSGDRYLPPVFAAHPTWQAVLDQDLVAWQALPGKGNAEYQDAYVDEQSRALRGETTGQQAVQRLGRLADSLIGRP